MNRFLALQGFVGLGRIRWRNRVALLAGWLLHLALLILMAGVLIELAFHDSGAFELVEGEWVRLSDPRVVFDRQQGPLAPAEPPPMRIGLISFDPYQHQKGYAPDRRSRLRVELAAGSVREFMLDRVEGARVGNVTLYQAMPSGLALVLDVKGDGFRVIHLRTLAKRVATTRVTDPKGRSFYFEVESERDIDNRRGTGALKMIVANQAGEKRLAIGDVFDFGFSGARLVDVARLSGLTYARTPGMPAVFCGFALVLAASFLLAFPAGIAHVERRPQGVRARIWLNRGAKVMLSDWEDFPREATSLETNEGAREQCATLGET